MVLCIVIYIDPNKVNLKQIYKKYIENIHCLFIILFLSVNLLINKQDNKQSFSK